MSTQAADLEAEFEAVKRLVEDAAAAARPGADGLARSAAVEDAARKRTKTEASFLTDVDVPDARDRYPNYAAERRRTSEAVADAAPLDGGALYSSDESAAWSALVNNGTRSRASGGGGVGALRRSRSQSEPPN